VRTRVLGPDGWLGFQEYFVREKTQVEVRAVEYAGAPEARPAPGLVEAIGAADAVLVCPSNPVTSVGPILSVPGIVEALHSTRAPVLGISPIVGGRAVSGPAGRLMAARGLPVSALGIAQSYAPWLDVLIIDDEDAALAPSIEAAGARPVVASTLMAGRVEEMRLARRILETLA
jgi:LPPG:FO 2-phospho-L-lactate transferase